MAKPLILITNDDGIYSPGLKAAAEAVSDLGELLIAAPKTQQTSASRSEIKDSSFGVIEEIILNINGKDVKSYAITGTPALAVAHAVWELTDRKVDLCVSGINYGENIGSASSVSGTIGAALEAASFAIPAVAVSFEADIKLIHTYSTLDWRVPRYFTHFFAERVLAKRLPQGIDVLNVNIPDKATEYTPVVVTRQSDQDCFPWQKPEKRDFSKPFRMSVKKDINPKVLEADSDIKAFAIDRVVSVSPLTLNLTAQVNLKKWSAEFLR